MKRFKRLSRKKGFTLVECMVAIAMFAIMSAIVMQILAVSIKTHALNNRTDKDLDAQIESIVQKNGTSDRGTFDLTLKFLGGSGTVSINDISIIRNTNDIDERLELNTMEADIPQASGGGNADPAPGEGGSGGGVTDDGQIHAGCHVYGSSGLQHVIVEQTGINDDGTNVTVSLNINISSPPPNYVLSQSYAQSVKIAMPTGSKVTALTVDNNTYAYILGQTLRICDKIPDTNKSESFYTASFSMRMTKNVFDTEYKNFANYFIEKGSDSSLTYAVLKDTETPGLYNKT